MTKKTLPMALARAQAMADRIDKDSRNDFARYDYTSAESMMAMWTKIGEATGLNLYPAALNIEGDDLRTCWVLEHAESGATREIRMDWPIVESKGKPREKAVASARTSSLGYLIRDLLIAPRVHPTDDMDHPRWSMPEKSAPKTARKAVKATPGPGERDWSGPYAEALLSCPGQPSPSEVEGVCRRVRGEHPSELSEERVRRLIGYIGTEPGQKVLLAVRGEK